jgi:hypothetical protein
MTLSLKLESLPSANPMGTGFSGMDHMKSVLFSSIIIGASVLRVPANADALSEHSLLLTWAADNCGGPAQSRSDRSVEHSKSRGRSARRQKHRRHPRPL